MALSLRPGLPLRLGGDQFVVQVTGLGCARMLHVEERPDPRRISQDLRNGGVLGRSGRGFGKRRRGGVEGAAGSPGDRRQAGGERH
ncbi:hypothetical protein MFUR16E_13420 [Methylobacterium fujisawaense]